MELVNVMVKLIIQFHVINKIERMGYKGGKRRKIVI